MQYISPTELKTILHSKRANIYYLEHCRLLVNGGRVECISLPNAPKNCYALKVSGESMEPTFRHNDYVLFVIDQDIKSNDVVIVNDDFGESMVRRYKVKDDGEASLVSDNPAYTPLTPNGNYRTVGKVVGAWRQLNI